MTREKSGLSQFFAACAIVVMSVAVGVAQDGEPAKSAQAGAVSDSGEDAFEMIDHPIAILPFKTRGKEVSGMGEKISDLMFAQLIVDPTLNLVDREDLSTVLTEAELNISGVVNPQQASFRKLLVPKRRVLLALRSKVVRKESWTRSSRNLDVR